MNEHDPGGHTTLLSLVVGRKRDPTIVAFQAKAFGGLEGTPILLLGENKYARAGTGLDFAR